MMHGHDVPAPKAPEPTEANLTSEESPDSIAQRIEKMSAVDIVARIEELNTVDRVAHELLRHPDMLGAVNEKQMRWMLRYIPGIRDLNSLSNYIRKAVVMLVKD